MKYPYISVGATFSPCRTYRYKLWRIWDRDTPSAVFIMLNPSTADEMKNDPTVTRCETYARSWKCGGLMVGNIFALRSTDPRALRGHPDPIGPENNQALLDMCAAGGKRVCAWGNHGSYRGRSGHVLLILGKYKLHCLRVTKMGEPAHPLYLPRDLMPTDYTFWMRQGGRP